MLTKSYVFTNDDWYKKLDWSDRTCECGRNMDCISDKLIEFINEELQKQTKEIEGRLACVSSLKNSRFVFHRLSEVVKELNDLRKSSETVEDYLHQVSDAVVKMVEEKQEEDWGFTVLKWLDVAEDVSTSLDHACLQDPVDKVSIDLMSRNVSIMTNVSNFFTSFKESLKLQYVLLKSPVKYRKTLIKLCRKQCAESVEIGSTINIDQMVFDRERHDADELKGVLKHELKVCKTMLEQFRCVEKGFDVDPDGAWKHIESLMKGSSDPDNDVMKRISTIIKKG